MFVLGGERYVINYRPEGSKFEFERWRRHATGYSNVLEVGLGVSCPPALAHNKQTHKYARRNQNLEIREGKCPEL